MFTALRKQITTQLPRQCRSLSQIASTSEPAVSSTSSTAAAALNHSARPYFVPRNTRGNIPVYSDVRNAGGRYLVLIRNIEGNVSALAKDLTQSLYPEGAPETHRMNVQVNQSKHLVVSGLYANGKMDVIEWLKAKGF